MNSRTLIFMTFWFLFSTSFPADGFSCPAEPCDLPAPSRSTAFTCLAMRDSACFADLSLQLAASVNRDDTFVDVSLSSARMRNAQIATHAAKSIKAPRDRALQFAILSRIFVTDLARRPVFVNKIVELSDSLPAPSLIAITKHVLTPRIQEPMVRQLVARVRAAIATEPAARRVQLHAQLALILFMNDWTAVSMSAENVPFVSIENVPF